MRGGASASSSRDRLRACDGLDEECTDASGLEERFSISSSSLLLVDVDASMARAIGGKVGAGEAEFGRESVLLDGLFDGEFVLPIPRSSLLEFVLFLIKKVILEKTRNGRDGIRNGR